MPQIELPDGHRVVLPEGEPIGSVLPPTTIVARFDGELVDLSFVPGRDGKGEPVTADEPDGLHVLRHSTAHVMAQAVCDLVPGAKYAIGPPIEDGFYYDFELPQPLTPDDLPRIEARMAEIGAADQPFVREELSRQQALASQGVTELRIPAGQLVLYLVLAGLAGVLAAILPARRAARLNVLRAISYE